MNANTEPLSLLTNRITNSRLLREIHELEGPLSGSDSEDSPYENEDEAGNQTQASKGLARGSSHDNSLMRQGKALLDAARCNPLWAEQTIPTIHIRLTRLTERPAGGGNWDPRIARTIQRLRESGVEVELGDIDTLPSLAKSERSPKFLNYISTVDVNLDLSLLIALVSDLAHAAHPIDETDAFQRFKPAQQREDVELQDTEEDEPGAYQHSRALAIQSMQEKRQPLIDIILGKFSDDLQRKIQLWTTPEAKRRCILIVEKLGGPAERRRTRALFAESLEETALFWKDSRYSDQFLPGLPVRVLQERSADTIDDRPPFWKQLEQTCRQLLHRIESSASEIDGEQSTLVEPTSMRLKAVSEEKKAPPPTRFTAHTLQTLVWGLSAGMTTMTANRMSIRGVLKEMKRVFGRVGGAREGLREREQEEAAVWVIEPKSLGERMRADFGMSTDDRSDPQWVRFIPGKQSVQYYDKRTVLIHQH